MADYFPAVAESVGDRLKVPAEHRFSGLDGYQRLIASGVDTVFLETPPYFFPQHARAAVEAGCHVFVAKPVAVDVPGSLSILDSGKKSTRDGKVFLVDFQTRTDPFHVEAIRRVHPDQLDELLHPMVAPIAEKKAAKLAKGLPAGPGGGVPGRRPRVLCRARGQPPSRDGRVPRAA